MISGVVDYVSGSRWVFAALVSIAVHTAVVLLFVIPSLSSQPKGEQEKQETPAVEKPASDERPPEKSVSDEKTTSGEKTAPVAKGASAAKGAPVAKGASADRPASVATVPAPPPKPRTVTVPEETQKPPVKAGGAVETTTYVVKKGDNLTRIAKDHGTTNAELARLNKVSEKKLANLWIGQKIKVPAKAD